MVSIGQVQLTNHQVLDVFELVEPYIREETSKAISGIQRCKSLAKVIKSQRAPPWPSPLTTDLPSKDVADDLVDCYLRTTESVYRILHIPTFKRDYETVWVSNSDLDMAFLVQLKLVLAIGAVTYDENFSLRASAVRWVYEAETWLSEPKFKSRLGIHSLQTNILILLAREIVGVRGDPIWISAGALLRKAVHMGLHRDPACLPKMTTLAAEMRRRIWNTILEVNLQSSLNIGCPSFISLDDFDTEPPRNFDDDQLIVEDAVPKPEDEFTQVSIARALCKTFPIRLAVVKFLNGLDSHGTYEETLRLDAEFRESYKSLRQTLQRCRLGAGPSPSRFEVRVIDFIMHLYLTSLHIPFFGPATHETAYAFARKVAVESSLKTWCAAYPSSSIIAAQSHSDTASSDRDDLARLSTCGSGFYRIVAMQAAMVIVLELRTQLREEESLGPVPIRADLLSILEDAKAWSLRCIELGETNIKGYLLLCIIDAHIKGLMRGVGKDELPSLLVKAIEDAEGTCLQILEGMTDRGPTGGTADALHEMSLNTSPEVNEDWFFMVSKQLFIIPANHSQLYQMPDVVLNPDNMDPMSWMFNDETMQEQTFQ